MPNFFFFPSLLLLFYAGLGAYPLLNNNEGLYAQIAWEMLQSGDWVIPHLNGVPYIEKPPLLYWLIALSFKVFGKTAFAARLVPATFGFATCLSLYFFARSIHKKKLGQYSAVILASFAGFMIFSRMVFFDVALTFFLTAAALCFYKFYETLTKKYLYLFSALMAGAVLTKGIVALALMGVLIISFLCVEKKLEFLKYFFNPVAILIFLGLTVPWHVAASLKEPGFAWFYFVNEHWMRFLDQRIPRDYYRGPWYYYVPRLLVYMVPWTFVIPFIIKKNLFSSLASFQKYLMCWFLSFLFFFSVSKAKANYYMVVGLPPLALGLGHVVAEKMRQGRLILIVNMGIGLALVMGGVWYMNRHPRSFSVEPSLSAIQKNVPIYLYKRFEELSTLPFYANRSIPIIDSESRDLWYAQQQGHETTFLPHLYNLILPGYVYVLNRDEENFLKKYQDFHPKIIYTSSIYKIFFIEK